MIVGAWRWPQYEVDFAKGLEAAGTTVLRFPTMEFFRGWAGRAQLALPIPVPSLLRLNRALIRVATSHCPDTVLFWRPTHVLPESVAAIKRRGGSESMLEAGRSGSLRNQIWSTSLLHGV